MNIFQNRFKELLNESGKTQNQICSDLKISKQKLSKWKTGYNEPNLDDLMLISSYFNVSSDYLLGLEDESGRRSYHESPESLFNQGYQDIKNSGLTSLDDISKQRRNKNSG